MSDGAKRLGIVKQVFASREHELARQLGEIQTQLDKAVALLNQLRDYRDRDTAMLRANLATDPGTLQNQQAFHRRLTEAVSQQELLIQRAKIERNEMRQRWLKRRCKTQSIEKLCDKRRETERRESFALEQKQQDELVQFTRERLGSFGDSSDAG